MATPCLKDVCRPVFERMARRLFELFDLAWRPPSITDDPVIWAPRDQNQQAHALCNAAMDQGRDWRRAWPTPSWYEENRHGILAFSDGGYRGRNQAAIGWIMYYVGITGGRIQMEPLAAEAQFVSAGIHDSFTAEVLALDSCIEHIYKYILRRARSV